MRGLTIVLLIITFSYCSVKKKVADDQGQTAVGPPDLDSLKGCQYNSDSSFAACLSKLAFKKPGNDLSELTVWSVTNDTLVYTENIPYAVIRWIDKETLEIKKGLRYLKDFDTIHETYHFNTRTYQIKNVGKEFHSK